jgi:hypothetical protein
MRKTIALTGRKQLPLNAFDFQISEVQGKRVAALSLVNPSVFKGMSAEAEIRVRLYENKFVEILKFGTVGKPVTTTEIAGSAFAAPSCQVRIVGQSDKDGLLLGSTKPWTYKSDGDTDGILLFQPFDTSPLAWKLDIRDDENPILYVDKRIPDAAHWARTNPIFTACIFPHVIERVFRRIFEESQSKPEDGWMSQWVGWAEKLVPTESKLFGQYDKDNADWVEGLIATFAAKHKLADGVVNKLTKETAQ